MFDIISEGLTYDARKPSNSIPTDRPTLKLNLMKFENQLQAIFKLQVLNTGLCLLMRGVISGLRVESIGFSDVLDMQKAMGNQNATGIQQDGNVNDQASNSLSQENINGLNMNNEKKQISSPDDDTNKGVFVEPSEEVCDRLGQNEAPQPTKACVIQELQGNEEMPMLYEAQDESNALEDGTSVDSEVMTVSDRAALNDTTIITDPCFQEEHIAIKGTDPGKNHLLSESEPSDTTDQDAFDAQSVHASSDEPLNEDYYCSTQETSSDHEIETGHGQLESNSAEHVKLLQATDMTEEKASEEAVGPSLTVNGEILSNETEQSETDVKYAPQAENVEVDADSGDTGRESDHDNVETSYLLDVGQEYPVNGPIVHVEDTTMPVVETPKPISISQLSAVQNDMIVVAEEPTTMEFQSFIKDMESLMVAGMRSVTDNSDGQTDGIKEAKEKLTSLPNLEGHETTADTYSALTELVSSNVFNNKDELSEKNVIAHSESGHDKIRCIVITQATEPTKPAIEGFIFTDQLRNGEVMINNVKGNLQIERCPSFNFDIKNDSRPEESNHTPLLYQNKPPMRSLSSPGNVFFSINQYAGSDQQGQGYADTCVKEKTIILERTDSEKSRTPLLGTDEEEEGKSVPTIKLKDSQNEHLKGEMMELPKGRQKLKTRPSFFSSCVCCAGVDQLNADF